MSNLFNIARHFIKLEFDDIYTERKQLLLPFMPFNVSLPYSGPVLFELTFVSCLPTIKTEALRHITTAHTNNGDITIDEFCTGGYQLSIHNLQGEQCCLIHANRDLTQCKAQLFGNTYMQRFGLTNATMIAYAFTASLHDTLLLHAALIRHHHKAYAFVAPSGIGKSTHAHLWLQHIANCDLINDDNPILRVINNKVYAFGSPWSGKTPCYRQTYAELGALVQISRAESNSIHRLSPILALSELMGSSSTMKWNAHICEANYNTFKAVIEAVPYYQLHCLPNKEAAFLCMKTITK